MQKTQWRGRHAVARVMQGREEQMRQMHGEANMQLHTRPRAEQEGMQQTDGKAVIGEAAKKDGEADMQLHGLGKAEALARPREREWRGRNAVG